MFFWTSFPSIKRQQVIDLNPLYNILVTPEGLIEMYEKDRENIERVRFVPGRLGSNFFGQFLVSRKRPIYEVLEVADLALK